MKLSLKMRILLVLRVENEMLVVAWIASFFGVLNNWVSDRVKEYMMFSHGIDDIVVDKATCFHGFQFW